MWVKICGIRQTATASAVAALAPDAIGLNFHARTPRYVSRETAAEIAAKLPPAVEPVALFVDESVELMSAICRECSVDTIQLHGDEPPELLRELARRGPRQRVIRAWNLGPEGLGPLGDYLDRLQTLNVRLHACLIDARVAGMRGGTGRTVDWNLLDREYDRRQWPPMILAGGLTPDNVAEAIHAVRPWGVDVASGVESSPGTKDLVLVERFIQAARAAFRSLV